MVSFTMLSDLILSLQDRLPPRPVPAQQFREAAAELAVSRYGDAVLETPAFVNLAGLALSLERPVVYRPDAAAIAQIDATDLRNVPAEPPRLMRGAFLIETQDLQEPLFLDVVSFGAYRLGADWWLVCERFPDGIAVVRWAPVWAQQEEIGAGDVYGPGKFPRLAQECIANLPAEDLTTAPVSSDPDRLTWFQALITEYERLMPGEDPIAEQTCLSECRALLADLRSRQ